MLKNQHLKFHFLFHDKHASLKFIFYNLENNDLLEFY